MSKFDSILFDLDGTLWDVTPLVTTVRNDVMKQLGIQRAPLTREDTARYIGLPVDEIYVKLFPQMAPEERARFRVAVSAEIARRIPTDGGQLYPGVVEGLRRLKGTYPLFIVSNCSSGYIDTFLKWAGLTALITDHECFGTTQKSKGENIRLVVQRNHLKKPLFVGDTDGDHQAALDAGISYIHVDYGFGKPLHDCTRVSAFTDLVALLS